MLGLRQSMTKLLICAGLWLGAAGMPVAMADDSSDDEDLLKAAFIYNFALFTHWPDNAPDAKSASLSLCIAGEDELVDALVRLRGKTVKGHPLAIQTLKDAPGAARSCQLLYVASTQKKNLANLMKQVRGQPTLTISELSQFASAGGIIELYRENGRIRFIINLGVAHKAGLEISPNLLKLATVLGAEEP
jgi:hypothetical protein